MTFGAVSALILFGAILLSGQKSGWPPGPNETTIRLWPDGAPRQQNAQKPEADTTTAQGDLIAGQRVVRLGNVSDPTLTVYRPKENNTGAAVVVFPGGAYQILAMDLEGTEVCDWLASRGVTCILLKYRVPDSGPYPRHAAALQDAQRTLGIVREHATDWGIDPGRVGVLGFSAGGHLVAALSTHFEQRVYDRIDQADQQSCRPDFAILIYPAYLTLEQQNFAPDPNLHPPSNTPPTFIVQTEDDPIHVENALVYFRELKNANVPAELHIYPRGGHGYGLRRTELPVTEWPVAAENWLRSMKVIR